MTFSNFFAFLEPFHLPQISFARTAKKICKTHKLYNVFHSGESSAAYHDFPTSFSSDPHIHRSVLNFTAFCVTLFGAEQLHTERYEYCTKEKTRYRVALNCTHPQLSETLCS